MEEDSYSVVAIEALQACCCMKAGVTIDINKKKEKLSTCPREQCSDNLVDP